MDALGASVWYLLTSIEMDEARRLRKLICLSNAIFFVSKVLFSLSLSLSEIMKNVDENGKLSTFKVFGGFLENSA